MSWQASSTRPTPTRQAPRWSVRCSVLRDECRRAKERLSDETATAIVIDVPGMETTVRIDPDGTRPPDRRARLPNSSRHWRTRLDRNRIPLASISAVATIGGGARIPLITQRLSEHLRTTVVTTPQPQLTAAEGVALIAHRSQVVETATAMAPAAPATATVSAAAIGGGASPAVGGALAWSEVDDDPYDALHTEPYVDDQPVSAPAASRPEVHFQHEEFGEQPQSRRRSPAVLFALAGGGRRSRRGGLRPHRDHAGHLHRSRRHVVEHRPRRARCGAAGACRPASRPRLRRRS